MSDLLQSLVEAGLLQFGRFTRDDSIAPVQFHLEMLASYPDVLNAAAEGLSQNLPPVERLLCIPDALPLGVAIALKTGVPLVYSRGGDQEPVHDLVGAYDIGHPAVLVANVGGNAISTHLLASARRVGLNVQSMAAVIDLGVGSEMPLTALLHLPQVVDALVERGVLPQGQAMAVKAWIEAQIAK